MNWNDIRKEYEETTITMRKLADKHGVSYSTLRGRKKREQWQRKEDATKADGSDVATDNVGGQRGNGNAKGNKGGKAPPGNKNAVSHGLYANFLPEETRQLMAELHQMSPADMIWQNILIQYSAIVRAQKIMYVRDEFDDTSNIISVRVDPMFEDKDKKPVKTEEKREWHMAYDKQERFLNAQSRAMSTLSNLIKQFVSLADDDDKRKLELHSMQVRIKLMELKANEDNYEDDEQDDGFLDALKAEGAELWPEE